MTWKDGEYQPKQQRADEKKGCILKAALKLFGTRGYHKTTAKAIAAEAGVATGSFYRYFRDKKAAFMAVCLRMEKELGGRIFEYGQKMRQEGHSEQESLASLIGYAVSAHGANKAFHREVLAMRIRDDDVAALAKGREKRQLAALLEFLKAKQSCYRVKDLKAAAELIYYTIEEVSHRAVLFDSKVGQKRLTSELQNMVLRYMFD